jgi:hypothetical protein
MWVHCMTSLPLEEQDPPALWGDEAGVWFPEQDEHYSAFAQDLSCDRSEFWEETSKAVEQRREVPRRFLGLPLPKRWFGSELEITYPLRLLVGPAKLRCAVLSESPEKGTALIEWRIPLKEATARAVVPLNRLEPEQEGVAA